MLNKYKKKRLTFIGLVFIISLISLAFIVNNFRDNIVFFYSPKELENPKISSKIKGRQIRVGGLIVKDSVKRIDSLTTEFKITDNIKTLKITHKGILPNLFRENQGIVAKGRLNLDNNHFFSRELLIKHDENYMPPEVAKNLK